VAYVICCCLFRDPPLREAPPRKEGSWKGKVFDRRWARVRCLHEPSVEAGGFVNKVGRSIARRCTQSICLGPASSGTPACHGDHSTKGACGPVAPKAMRDCLETDDLVRDAVPHGTAAVHRRGPAAPHWSRRRTADMAADPDGGLRAGGRPCAAWVPRHDPRGVRPARSVSAGRDMVVSGAAIPQPASFSRPGVA
jgi:hypothetical protein